MSKRGADPTDSERNVRTRTPNDTPPRSADKRPPLSVPRALLERISYAALDGTRLKDASGFTSFNEMVNLPYNFVCGKKIGAGSRGAVFDIEDVRTDERVALKVIPDETIEDDITLPSDRNAAQREIATLLALRDQLGAPGSAHFSRMRYYFKMKLSDLIDFYDSPQANSTYLSEIYVRPESFVTGEEPTYSALGEKFGYFVDRIEYDERGVEEAGPRAQAFHELMQVFDAIVDDPEAQPSESVDRAYYFIVLDLIRDGPAGRGPISRTLDKTDFKSLSECLTALKQLIEAMIFLQRNRIIHGDLHDRNIALQRLPNSTANVKIIDFGFSCAYPELGDRQTPAYSCKAPQDKWRYSFSSGEQNASSGDFPFAYSFALDPYSVLSTLRRMLLRTEEGSDSRLVHGNEYAAVREFLFEEVQKAKARMARQVKAENVQKNRFLYLVKVGLSLRFPLTTNAWNRIISVVNDQIEATIVRSVQTADISKLLKDIERRIIPIIASSVSQEVGTLTVAVPVLDSVKSILSGIVSSESKYAESLGEDYTALTLERNFSQFDFRSS